MESKLENVGMCSFESFVHFEAVPFLTPRKMICLAVVLTT